VVTLVFMYTQGLSVCIHVSLNQVWITFYLMSYTPMNELMSCLMLWLLSMLMFLLMLKLKHWFLKFIKFVDYVTNGCSWCLKMVLSQGLEKVKIALCSPLLLFDFLLAKGPLFDVLALFIDYLRLMFLYTFNRSINLKGMILLKIVIRLYTSIKLVGND